MFIKFDNLYADPFSFFVVYDDMLGIGHDVQFFNAQTQCDPDGFGCGFKLRDVVVLDGSIKIFLFFKLS